MGCELEWQSTGLLPRAERQSGFKSLATHHFMLMTDFVGIVITTNLALVAELADAPASEAGDRMVMRVQFPPGAPNNRVIFLAE